jgi:WD40 repeat protein
VTSLAIHPTGKQFASGSDDHSVIIWSTKTFEVLRRIRFPEEVQTIAFGKSDTLYAGIFQNMMSCNALTGEVGLVLIPGTGYCESISFRKTPHCMYSIKNKSRSLALILHSTCTQALDFIHTCTVALACTATSTQGCGGAVEGARSRGIKVPAI